MVKQTAFSDARRDRFLYNLQLSQALLKLWALLMFSIRPLYTFPSAIDTPHSPCTPDRGNVSCLRVKQTAFLDARRETYFYIIYSYQKLHVCFQYTFPWNKNHTFILHYTLNMFKTCMLSASFYVVYLLVYLLVKISNKLCRCKNEDVTYF